MRFFFFAKKPVRDRRQNGILPHMCVRRRFGRAEERGQENYAQQYRVYTAAHIIIFLLFRHHAISGRSVQVPIL